MPSCVMSRTNRNRIQKCQNNTIRWYIHVNADEEARNENMYRRAKKTWEKLQEIDETLCEKSMEANTEQNRNDHNWWRRVAPYVAEDDPEAEY